MLTLNDGRSELWQWDTGRKLTVDADCTQVHFSNKFFGRSVDVDVADGVAEIPDVLLQVDKDLLVWAFVGTAENGYTKISKVFKVNRRNKPADYVFTPTDQTSLEELIERLDAIEESQDPDAIKNAVEDYLENNPVEAPVQSVNGYTGKVELTAEDVGAISQDDLQEATNEALAQAKASGEFDGQPGQPGRDGVDGKDGYTPIKGIDYFDGQNGQPGKDGKDGKDGIDGQPGKDGYTPQKGIDYFDGKDGLNGKDGVDGYTPVKGVDYFDGKDGQNGSPGKDGSNGKDGVSATHSWNGTTLTVTSASGTSSADLKGAKGDKGEKGAKGDKGDQGIQGEKGEKGETGAAGSNGADGKDGANGTSVTVKSVSESTADGGSNVVTFSDGKTVTIKNGKTGADGKDYSFSPTAYGLPILYLIGDTSAMTKDNAVSLSYVYGENSGSCTLKWQGSSSLSYDKKNYTIKLDTAIEMVEGWTAQKKYCLKANFIDHSHARNVVCAKLWGRTVKSRKSVSTMLSGLPNGGAIDGFPCVIMLNGEFHGLYTWNIPKDGWMYGMSSGAGVSASETLEFDTYTSSRVDADGSYTASQSLTAYHIRKRNTLSGGRLYVDWDVNKMNGFHVKCFLFDGDGNLSKVFCGHNGTTLSPYYSNVIGELGEDAWLEATKTRADDIGVIGPFSLPLPAGHTVLFQFSYTSNTVVFPDGTITPNWSSAAEANGTWSYTYIVKSVEVRVDAQEQSAIFGADTTSEPTRFQTMATLNGDFDLEFVSNEDDPSWALTSLNRLITACINSDGSDLDTTVAKYLDWDSAIDYYVYCCAVGGADMAGKNYLLYTFDGAKWGFGAYDMDSTFGLWWNGKEFLRENHYPTIQWYAGYHKVMNLILTYKKDVFKARYAELRAGALSEGSIAEAFSNFIAQIPTPVYMADVEKWPTIPSTATNNLSQILNWYRMRVAVLDKEVEAL